MRKKVVVVNRLEEVVLNRLKQHHEVKSFINLTSTNDAQFLNEIKDASGIIGIDFQVDATLLDHAPKLEIISNVSVGYNNLDIDELTKRNIMATNTPDVLTDTVADTVFSLVLATARRIPELDYYVKSRQWKESLTSEYFGVDVHHKTLGIIGMGNIGQSIAQRAHYGFDMDILYHSRTPKPEAEKKYNAQYRSLENLLKESDFVILITPVTPETEGLRGIDEFKLMKRSEIFINGSRGKTIVEKDLIKALKEGHIAAAGLDVFEQEPIEQDNPLLDFVNVVTLPHIGSSTFETELKMSELAAENLISALEGKKPPTLINPNVWDKR